MVVTEALADLLETEIPGFSKAKAGLTFAELGVDSAGMRALGVAVERAIARPLTDEAWRALETPSQLLACIGEVPAGADHDINGVGLLYFATYPTISDICELRYLGRANAWGTGGEHRQSRRLLLRQQRRPRPPDLPSPRAARPRQRRGDRELHLSAARTVP